MNETLLMVSSTLNLFSEAQLSYKSVSLEDGTAQPRSSPTSNSVQRDNGRFRKQNEVATATSRKAELNAIDMKQNVALFFNNMGIFGIGMFGD